MKERPILLNTEMVRAILDGRKTQTRRVIKPQPIYTAHDGSLACADKFCHPFYNNKRGIECPYGVPGDRLWVRETWQVDAEERSVAYKATDRKLNDDIPWRPSTYMPRWACRILLEITDVRVERVQDITEEDAIAEGVYLGLRGYTFGIDPEYFITATMAFIKLWASINEKRGFGWEKNPFCWVVSFKRIEA